MTLAAVVCCAFSALAQDAQQEAPKPAEPKK